MRAEKEWSQAELAESVGVTRQCINAIETGKYEPGLDLAFKIARVFGKNIEEIFIYSGDQVRSRTTYGEEVVSRAGLEPATR